MHAAALAGSPRLRKALRLLLDGRARTTREIIHLAEVCAVNSTVAELRENGVTVECEQVPGAKGQYRYWIPSGALEQARSLLRAAERGAAGVAARDGRLF